MYYLKIYYIVKIKNICSSKLYDNICLVPVVLYNLKSQISNLKSFFSS